MKTIQISDSDLIDIIETKLCSLSSCDTSSREGLQDMKGIVGSLSNYLDALFVEAPEVEAEPKYAEVEATIENADGEVIALTTAAPSSDDTPTKVKRSRSRSTKSGGKKKSV